MASCCPWSLSARLSKPLGPGSSHACCILSTDRVFLESKDTNWLRSGSESEVGQAAAYSLRKAGCTQFPLPVPGGKGAKGSKGKLESSIKESQGNPSLLHGAIH